MIALDKARLDELHRRLEHDRDDLTARIDQIEAEEVHAENQYDEEFSDYGTHLAETGAEIYEQETAKR